MAASRIAMARGQKSPPRGRPRLGIPSWLVSLGLHVAVMATIAITLHRPVRIGDPFASEWDGGVYFGSGGDGAGGPGGGGGAPFTAEPVDADGPSGTVSENASSFGEQFGSDEELKVDETPPVELSLPVATASRLSPRPGGAGDTLFGGARFAARGSRATFSTGGGAGGGGSGEGRGAGNGNGRGGGGTTFFGQRANGAKFVYVLDASGSMSEYNAIAVAKAELLASLEQLDAAQQFQVIFYNDQSYPMPGSEGKSKLHWGTDSNRTQASQFIRSIQPDGGTRHLEALMLALSYGPDVIYFLTDAGEPMLYAADLDKIRKSNNGRAQIHAIEFGKGAPLNIDNNFLKRLARENGGGYAYRDATGFVRQ